MQRAHRLRDVQHPAAQIKLGANVRAVRKARGLTQERLALESELHRAYVGAVERGEVNLSLGNIVQLARTLGVTSADLVAGTETAGPTSR